MGVKGLISSLASSLPPEFWRWGSEGPFGEALSREGSGSSRSRSSLRVVPKGESKGWKSGILGDWYPGFLGIWVKELIFLEGHIPYGKDLSKLRNPDPVDIYGPVSNKVTYMSPWVNFEVSFDIPPFEFSY